MAHSMLDPSIERATSGGFVFPLGVHPIEPVEVREGYCVEFEPSDGGDSPGDWEEWPDRYLFEIVINATRLRTLCRMLFALLPGRVYPILDVLGGDAYREVDPYIAYDPVGVDRFIEALRRHGDWLYEDGLVGFGAMSDEPFLYVYVDEHKIVTVRAETSMREQVERTLEAFDLAAGVEETGVDTVAHEHRNVLLCPADQPDLLTAEEIIEEITELWRLRLNVDRHTNLDDSGRELGVTAWRCVVRRVATADAQPQYAEAILTAGSLDEAERLLLELIEDNQRDGGDGVDIDWPQVSLVLADRLTPEQVTKLLEGKSEPPVLDQVGVLELRWIPADEG